VREGDRPHLDSLEALAAKQAIEFPLVGEPEDRRADRKV
jgi:hypothetical protein